ncbi:2-oxo-4-hydroxy-4-carboxy-5-ureidoimidazoline decarboxylase [Aquibacillus albus]|uniref:2-oxo-4-hydroxy-4-carboxy-5-ureidoimidazoline decarboxylase n=1 Tax=Aquibacillus albus TaxID=1168171 RepID=A0ABS2MYZ2_9BACI|nr:2-oxo-4-hydroxy-4-carboxy-5-ureidoimidazoline decarboxylase [Aquibacillus albus]MBM7571119.1 OHCU decarboxylase [Aquibacillus albus]
MELAELNQISEQEFVSTLGEVFEHSPWIAKKAAEYRPFPSRQALHQRMTEIVANTPQEEKLELIRAHPNLGAKLKMSSDSTKEQQGAGLQNLTADEFESFKSLNQTYMQKFGFPFIFAVKGKNKDDIYQSLKERVNSTYEEEFETALTEIYKIAGFRLEEKVEDTLERI